MLLFSKSSGSFFWKYILSIFLPLAVFIPHYNLNKDHSPAGSGAISFFSFICHHDFIYSNIGEVMRLISLMESRNFSDFFSTYMLNCSHCLCWGYKSSEIQVVFYWKITCVVKESRIHAIHSLLFLWINFLWGDLQYT